MNRAAPRTAWLPLVCQRFGCGHLRCLGESPGGSRRLPADREHHYRERFCQSGGSRGAVGRGVGGRAQSATATDWPLCSRLARPMPSGLPACPAQPAGLAAMAQGTAAGSRGPSPLAPAPIVVAAQAAAGALTGLENMMVVPGSVVAAAPATLGVMVAVSKPRPRLLARASARSIHTWHHRYTLARRRRGLSAPLLHNG